MYVYPYSIQRLLKPECRKPSLEFEHPIPPILKDILFHLFKFDNQNYETDVLRRSLFYIWAHREEYEYIVMKQMVDSKDDGCKTYIVYAWYPKKKGFIVRDFIGHKAHGDNPNVCRTPEYTLLHHSLRHPEDPLRPVAWLCVDNPPFFFTVDENIAKKFITAMTNKDTGEMF